MNDAKRAITIWITL